MFSSLTPPSVMTLRSGFNVLSNRSGGGWRTMTMFSRSSLLRGVRWRGLAACTEKSRRSARTRSAMDGVWDVLDRLGKADLFDAPKEPRNGLAHGYISLADAIQTAKANMDLVRRALLLMILRVLGVEQPVVDKVLAQPAYKGSFTPFTMFLATIRFDPGDVTRLDGHPRVEVIFRGVTATRKDEKITLKPYFDLTPQNLKEGGMTVRAIRRAVDAGARMEFGTPEAKVVRSNKSE